MEEEEDVEEEEVVRQVGVVVAVAGLVEEVGAAVADLEEVLDVVVAVAEDSAEEDLVGSVEAVVGGGKRRRLSSRCSRCCHSHLRKLNKIMVKTVTEMFFLMELCLHEHN